MRDPDFDLEHLLTHQAWIHDLARRLVVDESAADDVAQDAWVTALTNPPTKPGPIRSWLRRVVTNRVFMNHRAAVHRRRREQIVARPAQVPSVAEIREREEARIKVTRAVLSLEEPYREAILYRYFENLPPREIAALLGVSRRAVEERLRRGLSQLRARLDHDFGDRRSWCVALLPVIGGPGPAAVATAAGGSASASILAGTGALVMGTKIKIGIAAIIVLASAYAFWPRSDAVEPPEVDRAEVARSSEPKREPEVEPSKPRKAADIRGAVTAEPRLEKSRPALVSLELARGSIVGQVTEIDGTPIAGAPVRALRYDAGALELKPFLSTRTDARGGYVLKPIQERCVVEASADDHYTRRRLVTPFSRQNFALGAPGRLRGRIVVAADRSPSVDASVAVYRFRPVDALDSYVKTYFWQRPPVAAVRTDATGVFAVSHLRPGRYLLRIVPPEGPEVASSKLAVDILAGRETVKDIAVSRGFDIVGRTIDHETKQPVAGVEVFIRTNPRKRAVTGEDGRYVLKGVGLKAMAFVSTRARDYVQWSLTALKNPANFGRRVEHDIPMGRAALVRGRVLGPDGKPVAGAWVGMSTGALKLPEERMNAAFQDELAVTDGEGSFELTTYASRRERRAYATAEGLAWGVSAPLVVTAGEETTGIVIRLERGAVLGGRITDASGKAVAAAQVTLCEGRTHQGKTYYQTRRTTFSRTDGRYEIVGIPPGSYRLEVLPPGLVRDGESRYAGAVKDGLVFAEGNRFTADVTLEIGPTIAGRVVDAGGRPVEGVVIRATAVEKQKPITYRLEPRSPRATQSDSDGRFTIQGLDDSVEFYLLSGWKTGFEPTWVRNVSPGQAGIEVTLRGTRSVNGRVTFAATGRPAAEFRLQGKRVAGPDGTPARVYSRPDAHFADLEGRFTLALVPGRYTIEAQTPDGQRSDAVIVDVPEVGTPAEIRLAVREGAALVGKVLGGEGTPVEGVALRLWSVDQAKPGLKRQVMTGSGGSFEMRSLESGTFVLYAEGRGPSHSTRAAAIRRLELRAGAPREINLTLRPGTDVFVTVTERGGGPVPGAKVSIRRTDGVPITMNMTRTADMMVWFEARRKAGVPPTTDAMSRFQKEQESRRTVTDSQGKLARLLLVPGEYTVEATAPGHAPSRKTVKVGQGAEKTVEIVLEKG